MEIVMVLRQENVRYGRQGTFSGGGTHPLEATHARMEMKPLCGMHDDGHTSQARRNTTREAWNRTVGVNDVRLGLTKELHEVN
jgi:hypothetical protein